MSHINIQLETESGSLYPGRNFTGKVLFSCSTPWQVREASLSIFWRAGNERRNHQPPHRSIPICRPGDNIPAMAEYPFRMMAPTMPWSFQGVRCSIEWFLRVTAHAAGGRACNIEVGIVVAPPGYDWQLSRQGNPTTEFSPPSPQP